MCRFTEKPVGGNSRFCLWCPPPCLSHGGREDKEGVGGWRGRWRMTRTNDGLQLDGTVQQRQVLKSCGLPATRRPLPSRLEDRPGQRRLYAWQMFSKERENTLDSFYNLTWNQIMNIVCKFSSPSSCSFLNTRRNKVLNIDPFWLFQNTY